MKLIEFQQMCDEEEKQDQLYEMARIVDRLHGIEGVVIWVGLANKRHGLRIKVSNTRNNFNVNDNFVIQMPTLDYDPKQVAKWITTKKLNAIFDWIKLNQKLLYDYENGLIVDTQEFLDDILSV